MRFSAEMMDAIHKRGQVLEPTPEQVARAKERNRNVENRWRKQLKEKKRYQWMSKSLWSGNRPSKFTFSQWQKGLQDDSERAYQLALSAWQICERMQDKDFNVLMTGDPGTGKTSLSLAIANRLWELEERPFLFISTIALAKLFNDKFHDDGEAEIHLDQLYRDAKAAKLLILDDFGTEGGMRNYDNGGAGHYKPVRKDMQEWLFSVADGRYNEAANAFEGSTIITTNNTSQDLLEMYNEKLISRLITKRPENTLNFNGLKDVRGIN